MKNTDLHVHSYYSDAELSPTDLIKLAKEKNLKCISLTDHNSVAGIKEALEAGKKYNIEVIPGIEIKADLIEVLGYFIDYKNKQLLEMLKILQERVDKQTKETIRKLNRLDYGITYQEIKNKYKIYPLMRAHIAYVMVSKNYFKDKQDVWDTLLSKGKPAYVKIKEYFVEEAVKLIVKAKGLPVLAHPWFAEDEYEKLIKNIPLYIKHGLVGIEIKAGICRFDNNPQVKQLKEIAKKNNLILTGGSDFHSLKSKNIIGKYNIDYKVVKQLKNKYKELFS